MRWGCGVLLLGLWGMAQEIDSIPAYDIPTVEIRAQRHTTPPSYEGVGERLMRVGLINLVYRSVPFAQEVVYQGLLPQQTQVTIEGMRILPACVDRMDPVLTFVEQASLAGASWSSTQSWGATPTLNITLLEPGSAAERYVTMQAVNNYHRLNGAFRLGGSKGRWHYAAAVTARLGGPYHSGRWYSLSPEIQGHPFGRDSVWNIASFKKYNAYLALRYDLSDAHQLEVRYLGDFFYDVAYPALVMDSRHSAFHLPSLTYNWKDKLSLRLYFNNVSHSMTDENRPESEIRTRIVMPGMYMPMKGITFSTGAVGDITYFQSRGWKLSQHSEYSYHLASADMDMYSLDGGASVMRLRNLADIRFHQSTHHLALQRTWSKGDILTYLSGSYFAYRVGDTLGFAPLRLYQERYADGSQSNRDFFTYQGGLKGTFRFSPQLRLSTTISYGSRPPTHTELYAYYLYVPMDNSIQMGNSGLRPERLMRMEARLLYNKHSWSVEGGGYFNRMGDYIAPVTFLAPFSAGNGTPQSWRLLRNTGRAYTAGGQFVATYESEKLWLRLQAGYTYGWHLDYREPLPWIYPFYGRFQVGVPYRRHRVVGEFYGAAAQDHLSRRIYLEDRTPAYWLLHLRYSYTLPFSRRDPVSRLIFQLAVENMLNVYGWDHLSVGNMPFLGRVISGGLWYSW